ncbi:MAG TPA: TolC family protein [Phycisphaerae bacterium]|nr:TolC family protein [Phycisphaerae bacterium]
MTSDSRTRSTHRQRLAALVALAILAGCATQPGHEELRARHAALDLAAYQARAPQSAPSVTLRSALECALNHNIEVWIAEQERQFQHELSTQSLLKLLPSLLAGAESSWRSELDAASSESLRRHKQSLEPSFSADQSARTFDISMTWSLLDFGISYFRARQQADRAWIAAQRVRRVKQDLALQVTRAYWQAVTARESAREAERIGAEVETRIALSSAEIAEQAISQIDGLRNETKLLEQQEELRRYQRAHRVALTELATLMGLAPGTTVELAEIDLDQPLVPPDTDVAALEDEALRNRPELYEKDREEEISRADAHVAIAQLFPNLNLSWRFDIDDNRFLVFNQWHTLGLRAAWDLLAIPQHLMQHHALTLQTELVARRRTALAVGILTQLHLTLIDCAEAAAQCRLAGVIAAKHRALLAAVESTASEGKSHDGETVDQRMRYLKARARYLTAYAEFRIAQARLRNTLGRDPGDDLGDDEFNPPLLPDALQVSPPAEGGAS